MAQKDESIQYLIEIICEELNITEIVPLKLPCVPSSFDDIRNAIEKSFFIPAFLQTMWVDGAKIDSQSVVEHPLSVTFKLVTLLKYPSQ